MEFDWWGLDDERVSWDRSHRTLMLGVEIDFSRFDFELSVWNGSTFALWFWFVINFVNWEFDSWCVPFASGITLEKKGKCSFRIPYLSTIWQFPPTFQMGSYSVKNVEFSFRIPAIKANWQNYLVSTLGKIVIQQFHKAPTFALKENTRVK